MWQGLRIEYNINFTRFSSLTSHDPWLRKFMGILISLEQGQENASFTMYQSAFHRGCTNLVWRTPHLCPPSQQIMSQSSSPLHPCADNLHSFVCLVRQSRDYCLYFSFNHACIRSVSVMNLICNHGKSQSPRAPILLRRDMYLFLYCLLLYHTSLEWL